MNKQEEEEMLRWQEVICKCGHRYNIQNGECPMCRLDKEEEMEKKVEEKVIDILNSKQKEAIEKYLEARFFQYGIRWFQFKYELTPKYSFKAEFTHSLPLLGLGIFRFALNVCNFEARVYDMGKDKNPLIVGHLSYEHIGGGTNGCELNIRLYVNSNGEIVEDYSK
jgi:hypothetical protein